MRFFYRSRDKKGEMRTGTIEAVNQETAIKILQGYELTVLEIAPQSKRGILDQIFGRRKKVFGKPLVIFLRQFATLLAAEVSLNEVLKTLMIQAATPEIRDLIFDLIADLDAGLSLSQAFNRQSDTFGEFYIQMIRAGEISGHLDEIFAYLADYAEYENNSQTKMKTALAYPLFLIGTFLIVGTIITVSLAPQLREIFQEFDASPPLATQLLINIGVFLSRWGLIAVIILTGLALALINYLRSPEGRVISGTLILKIPILGKIFQNLFIARFCETSSNLIKSGIPPTIALEIAGGATGNYIYFKTSQEASEILKRGEFLSNALRRYPEVFPPLISQMAAVGENTGRLEELLKKVAQYYQRETEHSFSLVLELLQPVLIVIIGFFVAFLVGAVLLPLYQLAQAV